VLRRGEPVCAMLRCCSSLDTAASTWHRVDAVAAARSQDAIDVTASSRNDLV